MATGALDANGIWQYGEDDSETTFSGLLNKLAGSTSSTVTRLEGFTGYTGTLPVANGGTGATTALAAQDNLKIGSAFMVPTAVNYSGGTAPTISNGQVALNNNTGVTIKGIFTGSYRNYKIIVEGRVATTGGGDIVLKWANGDIVNGANYYNIGMNSVGNIVVFGAWNNTVNGNVFALAKHHTDYDGGRFRSEITVYKPTEADLTVATATGYGSPGGSGGVALYQSVSAHLTSLSFDGVYFTSTSGNPIEGTVTVYGMN